VVPFVLVPIAPAGAQNAPGVTPVFAALGVVDLGVVVVVAVGATVVDVVDVVVVVVAAVGVGIPISTFVKPH